jgi:hypothetical protein
MGRSNIEGAQIYDSILRAGVKFMTTVKTLTGTLTMQANGEQKVQFLDPGGASRTVLLPAESNGDFMIVINTADAAENLTFKEDSNTTTILVTGQNEIGFLFCNGTTWFGVTGVA